MSSPGATRVDPDSRVLTGFSADYADAFRIVAVPEPPRARLGRAQSARCRGRTRHLREIGLARHSRL